MKFQKLAEKLGVGKPAPPHQWIVNEIRKALDNKMNKHSSNPELKLHFNQLFRGLENITDTSAYATSNPLDPKNTEKEIIEAFDRSYFKGDSTFRLATRLLADPRVRNVDHFSKAVGQGGTILKNWSVQQRLMFQLHVNNKLWVLKRRDEAREKLSSDYSTFWRQQLAAVPSNLSETELKLLGRALVVTNAIPISDVINNMGSNWRSLFVLWQSMVKTHTLVDDEQVAVENMPLWNTLVYLQTAVKMLPKQLAFVPATPQTAQKQIRRGLESFAAENGLFDDITESSQWQKVIHEQ